MFRKLFSMLKKNDAAEKIEETTSVVSSNQAQQVMVQQVQELDYSKYEHYAIKPDMQIDKLVEKYPQAVAILKEHGVNCVGCHGASMETLEQGCLGHGMPLSAFESLLENLNKSTEKKGGTFTGTLTITANTAERVKTLVAKDGMADAFLRFSVVPGGCSGFSYDFKVDNQLNKNDVVVEKDGAKVVIDPESLDIIAGSELDYVDGANGAKFEVNNPNAKSGCGCGSSFGV